MKFGPPLLLGPWDTIWHTGLLLMVVVVVVVGTEGDQQDERILIFMPHRRRRQRHHRHKRTAGRGVLVENFKFRWKHVNLLTCVKTHI